MKNTHTMDKFVPFEGLNLSRISPVESYHKGCRKRYLVFKGHTQPFFII